MIDQNPDTIDRRVTMLGTFGFQPKATMRSRALGMASALREYGWSAEIVTVPWDRPSDSGRRETIDGIPLLNTRTVRPSLWPLPVAEMVRETERLSAHLAHVFKPKGFGDLAGRLLRRRGVPVVVDMDDWEGNGGWNDILPYGRSARALFDWQERSGPSRAAAVTVASRTLQQRALELGAPPDRVFYVPNGLTSDRYAELTNPPENDRPDLSPLAQGDSFNVLLYTRFVEFEPEFVIAMLAKLSEFTPGTRLVIAGGSPDGSAERRLIASAHRSGIADRIVQLGWIIPSHLGHIAARCDAALVPFDDTLVNRSKCSVKLLELMACGVPIVASNVGENREYLRTAPFGSLARPGDVESHAAHLRQIANEANRLDDRPTDALQRFAERYLWKRLVPTVLNAYDRALCSNPGYRKLKC